MVNYTDLYNSKAVREYFKKMDIETFIKFCKNPDIREIPSNIGQKQFFNENKEFDIDFSLANKEITNITKEELIK